MARNTIHSKEPYYVGEIVEFIHSPSLGVIVDTDRDGTGVAWIIRACVADDKNYTTELDQCRRPVSPNSGARLPRYEGTLTDKEEALAMKYLLLGAANND